MASESPVAAATASDEPIVGEVVEDHPAETGDELAVQEDADSVDKPAEEPEPKWDDDDKDWPYQWIEYKGDRLAARKPMEQALTGLSMGTSKFTKPAKQMGFITLFVEQHMSDTSYDRVVTRMMDPSDTEYGAKSFAEVMNAIIALSRVKKDAKNDAADDSGDSKN